LFIFYGNYKFRNIPIPRLITKAESNVSNKKENKFFLEMRCMKWYWGNLNALAMHHRISVKESSSPLSTELISLLFFSLHKACWFSGTLVMQLVGAALL